MKRGDRGVISLRDQQVLEQLSASAWIRSGKDGDVRRSFWRKLVQTRTIWAFLLKGMAIFLIVFRQILGWGSERIGYPFGWVGAGKSAWRREKRTAPTANLILR